MTDATPTLRPLLLAGLSVLAIASGGCTPKAVAPIERGARPPLAAPPSAPGAVDTTIVGGQTPAPAPVATSAKAAPGKLEFTIPSADVRTLAQIVLRDTLHIPYTVEVDGDVMVSLATAGPVNRSQLVDLFEAALKKAGLAMVWQGSGYKIETLAAAKAEASGLLPDHGFANETVVLRFANADALKSLLDTVVPGAVQQVDRDRNALVIAGTEAQRKGVHDVIAQFDVNWLRSMSFALFVPHNTDARLIAPELDKLINAADAPTRGLVRLIAMDKLNGVIAITAQPQYLEDVRRWVEVLDREGTSNEPRLYVYRVQNGRSKDLVKTISAIFGASGSTGTESTDNQTGGTDTGDGTQRPPAAPAPRPLPGAPAGPAASGKGALSIRITSDDVNNAIVIYGSAHDYAIVEDALRKLDIAPMQVLIEAAITEVGLNAELQYGVQWNYTQGNSNFALSNGSTNAPVRNFPGFSYFYSSSDITGTLNALEQRTKVKVVSAPKLLVLNNQTAALQVGDQVPIQTASQQSTVGQSTVVNSIEYKDTGVILKITPRVNVSGGVLLDVSQEVSDVLKTSSSSIQSPTIATRKIATTVAVQDGQVIALGGLFRDSKSFGKDGLPLLSRIPILGSLFGNTDNTQNKTELIVLIKPHVLRSPDDLSAITEEMRQKISTLEPFKTKGKIP